MTEESFHFSTFVFTYSKSYRQGHTLNSSKKGWGLVNSILHRRTALVPMTSQTLQSRIITSPDSGTEKSML